MAQTIFRDKQALLTEFFSRIVRRKAVEELFDKIVESIPATVLVNHSKEITNGHALGVICNVLRQKRESNPSVARWLKDLLQHKDPKVKAYAAEALGDLHVRSAAPQLHKLFRAQANPVYVRDNSAMALGLLKYRQATRELLKELNSPHRTIRLTSAFALGNIGSPSTRQPLEARLARESDQSVKDAIIFALEKLLKKK